MDKDGCVPLDVIARFNRVRALTQDVIMIKEVCLTMGVWCAVEVMHSALSITVVTAIQQEGGDRS